MWHVRFLFALALLALLTPALRAQQADVKPQLMLWARPEDLKLEDGSRVGYWPDASGQHNHLRSDDDARPYYRANALGAGKPGLRFGNDPAAGITGAHYLALPMNTEWRGASIFIVGTGAGGPGTLFTKLSVVSGGTLRTHGYVQIAGTTCSAPKGFQEKIKPGTLGLASFVAGLDARDVMHLKLYANGELCATAEDPNSLNGIAFRDGRLGHDGRNVSLNGSIAEILIYRGMLSETERSAVERYLLVKHGLAAPAQDDPKAPFGYQAPARPQFPPVTLQPSANGLAAWMRADDLKLTDGQPVPQWANAIGNAKPLPTYESLRPFWMSDAFNGRSSVQFAIRDNISSQLEIPLETQEWPEMTVLIAGRRFGHTVLFRSAQSPVGSSVSIGSHAMVTRSKLALRAKGYPFTTAFTMTATNEPTIIAVTVGKLPAGGRTLAAYVNGYLQQQIDDPQFTAPLLVQSPILGGMPNGRYPASAEVAELLLYNRALSAAELQQATSYLAQKFAIALPTPTEAERQLRARSRWGIALPTIPHQVSWLGNTFNGVTDWMQAGASALTVLPDGTVAVASSWDERGKCIGFYKDGKTRPDRVNGAADSIASDATYLYRGVKTWKKPTSTIQLQRLTHDLQEAPWPALGKDKWPTWEADVTGGYESGEVICALAVGNGELFVNTFNGAGIKVYDAATGALKRTLTIAAPKGRLAIDQRGKLWVGNADGFAQYAPEGTPTGMKVAGVSVGGLCVDGKGRLLIAENGARQQVITYDISGAQPREIGTLGVKGGIYTAPRPGMHAPDRLHMPNSVGVDSAGNIYVLLSQALRAYTADGAFLWETYCSEFITCGSVDPASDGNDIYTPRHHYRYQPREDGSSEWAWVGTMVDTREAQLSKPFNGPVRRLAGRLYHFTLDDDLLIRRQQDNSEFFVPGGLIRQHSAALKSPPAGLPGDAKCFAWIDRNSDGKAQAEEVMLPPETRSPARYLWGTYVDEKGGIWFPELRDGVRYLPLKEIAQDGTLIYDYADEQVFKRPSEFIEIYRAYYDADSDTMYLAGMTWEDPQLQGRNLAVAGMLGREIIRYNDWMKPTRKLHSRMKLPTEVAIITMDISHQGQRLIAGDVETAVIFMFDTDSGQLLGILEPDADLIGAPGWIDVKSGIRIFTRANGDLVVISENCFSQQNIVYQLPANPQ